MQKIIQKLFRLCPLFLLSLAMHPWLAAQTSSSGVVLGIVTDQSGAVVGKAQVELTNVATSITTTQLTSAKGQYFFSDVTPGLYRIKVTATGFAASVVDSAEVNVNSSYTGNLQLSVGNVTDTVQVESLGQAELQTTDSAVGGVVSTQELQRLPTGARDALQLTQLQPGVTPGGLNSGGTTTGARSDQNTITLDGFDVSENVAGGQGLHSQSTGSTNVEGIAEFRVGVANPNAQFGRSAGANVSLTGKSGEDQYHGAVYWYVQNSAVNANTWENKHTPNAFLGTKSTALPLLHDNREGFAIGGPVWKLPKTFFFTRYEHHKFSTGSIITAIVPTASLRAGTLSFADCSNGTIDPATGSCSGTGTVRTYNLATAQTCGSTGTGPCDPRGLGISPTIAALYALLPAGNDPSQGDGLNTTGFRTAIATPTTDDDVSFRLDHNFTEKAHFFGRYSYFKNAQILSGDQDLRGATVKAVEDFTTRGTFAGGALDYQLTPRMVNRIGFAYIQGKNDIFGISPSDSASLLNLPGTTTASAGLLASLALTDASSPISNGSQSRTQRFGNPVKQFTDDFTWVKGRHVIALGADIHWLPFNITHNDRLTALTSPVSSIGPGGTIAIASANRPPTCTAAVLTNCIPQSQVSNYDSVYGSTLGLLNSTVLAGARDANLAALPAGTPFVNHFQSHSFAFYFEDTWRVTPSFTLNYGLNYGWQTPVSERDGLLTVLTDATSGKAIDQQAYFNSRKAAALKGQIFNPTLGFTPVRQSKEGRIYNTDYGDVGPRVSASWNPSFDKKTVFRGGLGILYDRTNQVSNFLVGDLGVGFGQSFTSAGPSCAASGAPGAGCSPTSSNAALSSFRVGQDGLVPLPTITSVTSPVILPAFPNPGFEVLADGIDPNFKSSRNYTADFTIQRELPSKMILEAGYIGRFARHLPSDVDLNTFTYQFVDPASGQSFAQAFDAVGRAVRTGTGSLDQPFFDNQFFPGYASFLVNGVGLGSNFANGDIATPGLLIDLFQTALGLGPQFTNRQSEIFNLRRTSFGYSNYNAGFVTLNKSTSRGLQFALNYTYSRSLDSGGGIQNNIVTPNPFNPGIQYGPSGFDRENVFNGTYDYELPFGSGRSLASSNGFVNKIIGGFYNTGIVTIGSGLPNLPGRGGNFGSFNGGVNDIQITPVSTGSHSRVTGSGGVGTAGNLATGGTGINLFADPEAALKAYRGFQISTDQRDGSGHPLRGFGFWNMDARLGKVTNFGEHVKADLSLDVFNVFNNVNFLDPGDPTVGNLNINNPSTFGVVTSSRTLTNHTSSARYLQAGLRISF